MADLRFSLSLGTGSTTIAGSLLLTNTTSRECVLSGYALFTWRDANGAVIPINVTERPDPQTPHTIGIPPGDYGFVGFDWQRWKSSSPRVVCTPAPKTLDVRLPPTVANPHPENGPAKRIAWFPGDSAGMCGAKVTVGPVGAL
jgi:hypothetical protein